MQGYRGQTKFTTGGNPTVTNGLHAFPSHPVARLAWGKRNELLQRLEFFETVFLLLHHRDKPCPTQTLPKASASSVQRLWPNGQPFLLPLGNVPIELLFFALPK